MGNRSSRDTSLSRRLVTFRDGQRMSEYAVTNYHSQVCVFDGINSVSFKFVKITRPTHQVFLELTFNHQYFSINKTKTYKEGNIMYIELENLPIYDHAGTIATHRIKWYDGLQKIHFNYDSTVN